METQNSSPVGAPKVSIPKSPGSLKKVLGFLLTSFLVVGAFYYYGFYKPAYDESKPPQIVSDSALQGLLIDKTTKFFKFEYSDVASFELTTDHDVDVPGKNISFYYSVKPISAEDLLRATYPVPGMKIAYADYLPDAEKMFHVYPNVSAHSNSRPITVAEGDDYIIPAFRGFALIAFGDTKLYHPDLRSFEDVPTQGEIDAARDFVLEEMADQASEPDANSSEGEVGNDVFCPEFPIPFEEEDWVLLPVNNKNVFKKVMNCINSNVHLQDDGSGFGYEAKYIWLQTDVNGWERLDEDEIVLADEDTYAEVGESGYSMVWFKIGTYEIVAPDVEDPIMCSYSDVSYGVGDTFPAIDGCNTCVCGEDGVVECGEDICDPEPITCQYDGESYTVGATFDATDGCNTCTCGQDGDVKCGDNTCGPDPVAPQVVMANYVEDDLTKVIVTFDEEVECTVVDKSGCFTVYLNEEEDLKDETYVVVDAVSSGNDWELTVDSEFTLGRGYVAEASSDTVVLADTEVGVDSEYNTAEFSLPEPVVVVNPVVKSATALNAKTIQVVFSLPVDCVGGASACFMVEPVDEGNTPVNVVDAESVPMFPGVYQENWIVTVNPGIDSSIEGDDDILYTVTAMAGIISKDGAGIGSPDSASVNVVEPASFAIPSMESAVANGFVIDVVFDMDVKCEGGEDCVTVLSTVSGDPDLVVVSVEPSAACESDYCENWIVTVEDKGVQIFPYNVWALGMVSEDGVSVDNSQQVSWPAELVQPLILIGAAGNEDEKNIILLWFSENVGYIGALHSVFSVAEQGNPTETIGIKNWYPFVGDGGSLGCEDDYPYCTAFVLELASDLKSDVPYLVVAKSYFDDDIDEPFDGSNYIVSLTPSDIGNVIDKDNNSAVVDIHYEAPVVLDPILNVSLSQSTPIEGTVVMNTPNYKFASFDFGAISGDVVLEGIDLTRINNLEFYGLDGLDTEFDYLGTTYIYRETDDGEVLLASGNYVQQNHYTSQYFGFSEPLIIAEDDVETLVVRADVPYLSLAYAKAKFGIQAGGDCLIEENDSYYYEVDGDFPVWGNYIEIAVSGPSFDFSVVEPDDNGVSISDSITYGLDLTAGGSDYILTGFDLHCLYSGSGCNNLRVVDVKDAGDVVYSSLVNSSDINVVFYDDVIVQAGTTKHLDLSFVILPEVVTGNVYDNFEFYASNLSLDFSSGDTPFITGDLGPTKKFYVDIVDRNVQVSLNANQPSVYNPKSVWSTFQYMNLDLTAEYGFVIVDGLKLTWKYGYDGTVNDFEEVTIGYDGADTGFLVEETFVIPNNTSSYESKSTNDAEFTIDLDFTQDTLVIPSGETKTVQILLKTEKPFVLGGMSESVFGLYDVSSVVVNPYVEYFNKDYPITVELMDDDGAIEGAVIQVN